MTSVARFRLLAIIPAAAAIVIFAGELVGELLRPSVSPIAFRDAPAFATGHPVRSAALAAQLAPLRSDIQAGHALALANQALTDSSAAKSAGSARAQSALRSALASSPLNARMWSAYAALRARADLSDPLIAELLKLSYYTGPQDTGVIALRLDIATLGNFTGEPEVRELARGDVRALLSPNMRGGRQAITGDYARGSRIGKDFLQETVEVIDPAFLPAMRAGK